MTDIRPLAPADFDAAVSIFLQAYPGMKVVTEEEREEFRKRMIKFNHEDPTATFYGLFRDDQLLGIQCFYDFTMTFLGTSIPAGGVGQIAVHLAHKKEHVAKEMIHFFLRHFRKQGTPLVALYPFRPDFYKQMGFGYGPKMNSYRIKPASLPRGPSKTHVRTLADADRKAVVDCYQRFAARTHGMMAKEEREVKRMFETQEHHLVGYERDGQIQGYFVYVWKQSEQFVTNDIQIKEFVYETPEALSELLTFLQTQADQVRLILLETQDEYLHFLLLDPRNDSGRMFNTVHHESNTQGVGLMFRVIDVLGTLDRLSERNFSGETCTLELTIEDSFLPENANSTLLRFQDGRLDGPDSLAYDVSVHLDISDFTSVLMGVVDFHSLVRYGLATISDEDYVDKLNRIFAVQQKPICISQF